MLGNCVDICNILRRVFSETLNTGSVWKQAEYGDFYCSFSLHCRAGLKRLFSGDVVKMAMIRDLKHKRGGETDGP